MRKHIKIGDFVYDCAVGRTGLVVGFYIGNWEVLYEDGTTDYALPNELGIVYAAG